MSEPVYRNARRVQINEELYATRRKLEEANHLLELAERKQAEVVAELQQTLQDCEEQATETCDGESKAHLEV